MVQKQTKEKMVENLKMHANDTGSIQVQIAALTGEIKRLTEHFKLFAKDFHSKRGLLKKVSRRKRFLDYLKKKDDKLYKTIIEQLDIRG